ncbi:MAG: twin-arginine translocation signal domain-containing protein [Planctomycetota bacterium]
MSSTRRRFLKTTAAASAFAAGVPLSQSSFAQDAADKLRLAAIGVGGSRGRYNRGGSIAMGTCQ